MSIDVHAHCIPADLLDALAADGPAIGIELTDDRRAAIAGGRTTMPLRPDLTDFAMRLAAMDKADIEVQVLSSWIDLTAYALDPQKGASWSRRVNEALAAEAAREPERFIFLATAPLQEPGLAARELRYATEELGAVGIEIATRVSDTDLADADLDPLWQTAAQLGSLVVLHPMDPIPMIDLKKHFLHNLIGRPIETTLAISRLLMAGLFDRHPDLKMCIVHGGGFLPYQIGRLQKGWTAKPGLAATDLAAPPLDVLGGLYFDTIVHNPVALRFLIDLVGADHIMLGTDYPFEAGDPDPIKSVDAIPDLTAQEREWILSGTAQALLGS